MLFAFLPPQAHRATHNQCWGSGTGPPQDPYVFGPPGSGSISQSADPNPALDPYPALDPSFSYKRVERTAIKAAK
jgi:hypothetical protein